MSFEDFNPDAAPDLSSAAIGEGVSTSPFDFSENDYPKVEDLLGHLTKSDRSMPFSMKELSKNGIVVADTMQEYLNAEGISSTACKEVLKTPLHYFHYKNQTFKQEKKPYFELGTFAHQAFLEPELFDRCIVEPSYSLASLEGVRKGIEFWENRYRSQPEIFPSLEKVTAKMDIVDLTKLPGLKEYLSVLKANSPLTAVDEESKLIIDILKSNYYRYGNGILPRLLRHSLREVSFYGQDPDTGLKVKVRPDGLQLAKNIGVNAVISFKTTSANNTDKFIYDTCKHAYELSEGMYQTVLSDITGKPINTTLMVMLQTCAPYLPALFFWNAEDLHNGKYKYRHAMSIIRDCTEKSSWPGFDAQAESGNRGIIQMKQPNWNLKELKPVEIEN